MSVLAFCLRCVTSKVPAESYAWLDTGTHASLLDASNFVRTLTERQGLQVGSPDEVAYQLHWITRDQLTQRAQMFGKNDYGQYLLSFKNA